MPLLANFAQPRYSPVVRNHLVGLAVLGFTLMGGSGCSRNLGATLRVGGRDTAERAIGVYACTEGRPEFAQIDPDQPLTLLVHGCTSSGARFRTLAEVFEAHGQQTLCFNYNDRDFLNTSATQLALALETLQRHMQPHEITIVGHSQGGLVARRALQSDLSHPLDTEEGFTYRLVTVSSPFDGIESAADCGRGWLHALSLTITLGVCMAIAGNKWTEIPPGSGFMTNVAPLVDEVTRHLQVVTDETGSCRRLGDQGRCEEDDFVFSLDEQYSDLVSSDSRVSTVEVESGHAAIVGENRVVPTQLISVLQSQGILQPTPPEQREEISRRLAAAYTR